MEEVVIEGIIAGLNALPALLQAAAAIKASGSGTPDQLAALNTAVAAARATATADVQQTILDLDGTPA